MQKYDVAIRADGNAKTGTGHVHRTIALASYLKQNFNITFYLLNSDSLAEELLSQNGYKFVNLIKEDDLLKTISEKTIVVIDGYNFSLEYQSEIKKAGHKLVLIDDLKQGVQIADVVINHGYTAEAKDYGISENTKLLCGPEYAILKKEFLNYSSPPKKTDNKKVLVCIGGTDPNNYSEKIILELLDKTTKDISLITYPINPNFEKLIDLAHKNSSRLKMFHSLSTPQMMNLISENDIAILQPSNIALEACSVGVYMALVKTEENQKYIHSTLIEKKCAIDLPLENLSDIINYIGASDINMQIERQKQIFDKKSPSRILSAFNALVLEPRRANEKDVDTIFVWSNDKVTRENSYNQSEIEYASHVNWFIAKIKDKNSCFLMFDWQNESVGTVRIDFQEKETVIGINVSPKFRENKLSVPMLQLACQYFFDHFKEDKITAYIKKTNPASLKSFLNGGFEIIDTKEYFGSESHRLIKQR